MSQTVTTQERLGFSVGEVFTIGIKGFLKNALILSAAALATLGTYAIFGIQANELRSDGKGVYAVLIEVLGFVVAGAVAYPWYSYALDAADGKRVDVRKPFNHPIRFYAQGVASFWFAAAALLGGRYLLALPSILALVFYAFYGYVIADGEDSGLKALGMSVRIGEGRRIVLFAMAGLFGVFTMCGFIAYGFGQQPIHWALAIAGLSVTSNITLIAGAAIYRELLAMVKPMKPMPNRKSKKTRTTRKTGKKR